jgi:hypothetical protein
LLLRFLAIEVIKVVMKPLMSEHDLPTKNDLAFAIDRVTAPLQRICHVIGQPVSGKGLVPQSASWSPSLLVELALFSYNLDSSFRQLVIAQAFL